VEEMHGKKKMITKNQPHACHVDDKDGLVYLDHHSEAKLNISCG